MERRLRSFFAPQGVTGLTDCLGELRTRPLRARRAARPRDDQRLAAVAPSRAVARAGARPPPRARRRAAALRAWSAGCSYGAEAFTLAAVCHAARPHARVTILGTDIDARMVARARDGDLQPPRTRATSPAAELQRGFDARARRAGGARPQLRAMTRFELGDLLRMTAPERRFDLIMCRNTVIYFAEPIRDELHARLAARCAPAATWSSAPPSASPSRPSWVSSSRTPSSTGKPDGHLRVHADVPRRGARAPAGAQPRRRAPGGEPDGPRPSTRSSASPTRSRA